jgi:hypothetical protein
MNVARNAHHRSILNVVPMLILVSTTLTISFLLLLLGARIGIQIGDILLRPNPFTDYPLLLPGQPASNWIVFVQRMPAGTCSSATSVSGNRSNSNVDDPTLIGRCNFAPHQAVFSAATVRMDGQRIHTLTLYSESLAENSVLLYLGMPASIDIISPSRREYILHWERDTYTAAATVTVERSVVSILTLALKSSEQ